MREASVENPRSGDELQQAADCFSIMGTYAGLGRDRVQGRRDAPGRPSLVRGLHGHGAYRARVG